MRFFLAAVISMLSLSLLAQSSIDIMYYNLLNFPGTTPQRTDTLKRTLHYVQPDVLVVNELISEEGADLILNQSLNIWGVDKYSRAAFTNGYDTDNMLFYNHEKVGLYNQHEIETELRLINEYTLYAIPVSEDTVFFSVFSAHLKASSGTQEENQRWAEVIAFKSYLSDKVALENIIFGGDLNIYSSSEKAYEEIVSGQNVNLYDPISMAGNWHNNSDYANIHTQSTRSSQFGGGASGGMDDRFDMIFVSNDILNGTNKLEYVNDSYKAFGQDGNRFNQSMISPNHESLPDSISNALYYMSDHLPVVMRLNVLNSGNAVSRIVVNPVRYQLKNKQIQFLGLEEDYQFQIIDLLGRSIFSQPLERGTSQIDLPSKLQTGVYVFRFTNSETSEEFSEKNFLK